MTDTYCQPKETVPCPVCQSLVMHSDTAESYHKLECGICHTVFYHNGFSYGV